MPDTAGTLTVGAQSGGANKFQGILDEVVVWDGTVLNDSQVANLWGEANLSPPKLRTLRRDSVGEAEHVSRRRSNHSALVTEATAAA